MEQKIINDFVRESNRIEGIHREPTVAEVAEFVRFLKLESVTVDDLKQFVSVYQPNAVIRDRVGLNVRVGNHIPPPGCPEIVTDLQNLLAAAMRGNESPYIIHCAYETLHPFTDGNGRSGRALWAWQMKQFPLGFLHHFYYQALQHIGR